MGFCVFFFRNLASGSLVAAATDSGIFRKIFGFVAQPGREGEGEEDGDGKVCGHPILMASQPTPPGSRTPQK